jgi:hypothetical protein
MARSARKSDKALALESHKYRLPNGTTAVSVSAIAKCISDDGKAMGFAYAAVRLAREGKFFKTVWDEKRDRGSAIHSHMEAFGRGEDVEAFDDELPILDNLSTAWEAHDIEISMSECVVLWLPPGHEDDPDAIGFGGRFDHVAWVTVDGVRSLWLLDLKTGKRYAMQHTLQLNLYAGGQLAIYDDAGTLNQLVDLPPIEHVGCLYVDEDGYALVEYPKSAEIFDLGVQMLNTLTTYRALEKAIKKGYKDDSSNAE